MKTKSHTQPGGFALIATLSLMVLLTVVALGVLTLSATTVRIQRRTSYKDQARVNARMALILALGELQREFGPDQRISAAADILTQPDGEDAPDNARWIGCWKSWTAQTDNGVDEPSEHATLVGSGLPGMHPVYSERRKDHFRRWLVSGGAAFTDGVDEVFNSYSGRTFPAGIDQAVRLVGSGSLGPSGQDVDFVDVPLVDINDGDSLTGRFGWWVGDESLKARVIAATPVSGGIAEQIERAESSPGAEVEMLPGLDHLSNRETVERGISRANLNVVSADAGTTRARFHDVTPFSLGVLADVRGGGLKRDLSAILDREISLSQDTDDLMLYRLGPDPDERVPLTDLAAYYQLYRDHLNSSGVAMPDSLQVKVADFREDNYSRAFATSYRNPVPIKIQFVLSQIGKVRSAQDKDKNPGNTDTHKLHIGITPAITYWNPYNVPLVLEQDTLKALQLRYFNLPITIEWEKNGGSFISQPTSVSWITSYENRGNSDRFTSFNTFLGGQNAVVFQPGEVRVFSLDQNLDEISYENSYDPDCELRAGWDPTKFMEMKRSAADPDTANVDQSANTSSTTRSNVGGALTFSIGDQISFKIKGAGTTNVANGSAIQFFVRQGLPTDGPFIGSKDRHYAVMSRPTDVTADSLFNERLMQFGFPDGGSSISYAPVSGSQLVSGTPRPFLIMNLAAGCEVSNENSGRGYGRLFASRPFLHSSSIHPAALIDRADGDSFYQHGWNWWADDINSSLEATVHIAPNNRNSFYGGGFTAADGSTAVIQQEIPTVPPMSIAALSHARLGGWSLGTGQGWASELDNLTAVGGGGLYPHTLQAIGNSYASPYLAPDLAYGTWSRVYNETDTSEEIPYADHSYLANKALWDEFFFSSIAPRETDLYGSAKRSAERVARDAFDDGAPLPNPRFTVRKERVSSDTVSSFFTAGQLNETAEKSIASHLLVKGAFNVNSTSVEAWKAVLSGMRGEGRGVSKNRSNPDLGVDLDTEDSAGIPVSQFTLAHGEGVGANPTDSAEWLGYRLLTEDEISQLADAMVRQVRQRGPFLSLSEFVNRRLDASTPELSKKGALQAALDDDEVGINAAFREPGRMMDSQVPLSPAFPEALAGPVAYGSAAYVDQADILRNLGSQLTPRGDTFVIRAYGDSVNPAGEVEARAWCEAVVQRGIGYMDGGEEPWLDQESLVSQSNKMFGRRFQLVSFRWLNPDEL